MDCGDGVQSFGKRRKKRDTSNKTEIPEELAEKLVYDPDLNQEIIYFATPLRKQIRVDSGTKVDEFKDESGIRTAGNGGNLPWSRSSISQISHSLPFIEAIIVHTL